MIIDTHRLTNQTLCTDQENAIGYYDIIILSLATLNSRKFRIPDKVYTLYSVTHNQMTFKLQINNGTSEESYTSTKDPNLYGAGQGI